MLAPAGLRTLLIRSSVRLSTVALLSHLLLSALPLTHRRMGSCGNVMSVRVVVVAH